VQSLLESTMKVTNESCQALLPHGEIRIAVGTHIAMRPPHRTGRAAFPHPAPTSGV
jgi:hypothetical protein